MLSEAAVRCLQIITVHFSGLKCCVLHLANPATVVKLLFCLSVKIMPDILIF